MNKSSIRSAPTSPAANGAIRVPPPPSEETPVAKSVRRKAGPVRKVLMALASLRLTVVLFTLSLILVFVGTLGQVEAGIFTVVGNYFRTFRIIWVPYQHLVHFGQVFFGVPKDLRVTGAFPFPGGYLLGTALLVNLLAAHAVRFKLSWNRTGILLIHAGLIVMLLGEFITGEFAHEANMTIMANGSSNYVENRSAYELAVTTKVDDKTDDVFAIPGSLLRKGGTVSRPELPFDVEVVKWMRNSTEPQPVSPGDPNLATAGDGLRVTTTERPEISGVDPDQKIDLPAAYVTFKKKGSGEVLGTYLVSLWQSLGSKPSQPVKVDDKTWDVSLRFERTYKPYTLHLIRFDHKKYMGTETAKDFRSVVQMIDPDRGENREVEIYMNAPLRYHGETFYQSSFLPGDTGTILQVVDNPGWVMPYVSCIMVSVGMLFHFGLHLLTFLQRRAAA
jgi:hypothetical protein